MAQSKKLIAILDYVSHSMPEDERACIESGMDGFLSKPFDREKLKSTILQFCQKNRSSDKVS